MEPNQDYNEIRPSLCSSMPESEFLAWYWLKAELATFCRQAGLSINGSKTELTIRIAAFLGGRQLPPQTRKYRGKLPEHLTLQTVIPSGCNLSRRLRAFFELHEGTDFHFNQALRDFFREPAGRTLGDALTLYRKSVAEASQPIADQFEYNRHMREFFSLHPGTSASEARLAWWEKRRSRKTIT